MLRSIASIALATLAGLATTAATASERQANYSQQYTCSAARFVVARAVPGRTDKAAADEAVEVCVTQASLAREYKGYVKYEERNPDTLAKELAERRNLVAGALQSNARDCSNRGAGRASALLACLRKD